MNSIIYNGVEYKVHAKTYLIAYDGTVLHNYMPYQPAARPDGYLCIRHALMHRIVAAHWVINTAEGKHVHHKDGDRTNNHADNLEWITPKTHMGERHKDIIGRQPCPQSARDKIRLSRLGSITPEETKQKQREASIRLGCKPPSWLGRKKTQEQIDKTVEKHQQPCIIQGVQYPSMKHASLAIGIIQGTIRKRCLSKNFPDYFWLAKG